jgi:hypothetical protein
MDAIGRRDTLRKKIIRSVLADRGAVILDELRWIVLPREARAAGKKVERITVAAMNSFARTVREYMPDLCLHEIGLGDSSQCPASLIAATAVYRLRDAAKLNAFLHGQSPTVECREVTDLPVHEFGETPRYERSGFATPQYHLHLVDLSSGPDAQGGRVHERIKIPPSHKVTIVGACRPWSIDQVLASQVWCVIAG